MIYCTSVWATTVSEKKAFPPFVFLPGKWYVMNYIHTCFHTLTPLFPSFHKRVCESVVCAAAWGVVTHSRLLAHYFRRWRNPSAEGPGRGWGSFVTSPTWLQHLEIAFCFQIEYITYLKLYIFIIHSLSLLYLQMVWINFSVFPQHLHRVVTVKSQPLFNRKMFSLCRMWIIQVQQCWHPFIVESAVPYPFIDGQNSRCCTKKSYMSFKKEISCGILDVRADKEL